MKQRYNFSLFFALLVVCAHQFVSSSDSHPNKRQCLTHLLSNASSSKPRYHTRLVTEYRAQQAEKLTDQLEHYKKLEKKRDTSTPLTTFKYLDLPVELQREVSDFYGINQLQKAPYYYFLNRENPSSTLTHLCPQLHVAISKCDGDQVQILIALHADINRTHADRFYAPLYLTIKECNLSHSSSLHRPRDNTRKKTYAIFKYLLQKGADCNKPNPGNNKNPLIKTAQSIKTIRLFLDLIAIKDINLHVTNKNGETVLDLMKEHAMCKYYTVDQRKYCYKICAWLEKKGVASSVILEPIPTDQVMLRQCWNSRFNPRV